MTFHSFCMVDLLSVSPSVVGLIARGHKNCTTQNFHTMKYTVVALAAVVDAGGRPLAMSQTKKKSVFHAFLHSQSSWKEKVLSLLVKVNIIL